MLSNSVNIKDLGDVDQVNSGDLLIVETANGTKTIDFTNFVVGPENVSWYTAFQTVCAGLVSLSTNYINLSAGNYPAINTSSITARNITLIHQPENDGVNPYVFIGERSLTTGITGFNLFYDEINNLFTISSIFGTTTANAITIDRASNIALSGSIVGPISIVNGLSGGIRNVPVDVKSGTYTLTQNDVGRVIRQTSTAAITIPVNVFMPGDQFTIINDTGSNNTITLKANVYAYIAGVQTGGATDTNYTLAARRQLVFTCTAGGSSPYFFTLLG